MEVPDVKRPRLEHNHMGYHTSGPALRPASTPVTASSHHQPNAEHPPSAPPGNSYPTPTSLPPPTHPPAQSGGPAVYFHETSSENHRRASYQSTAHPPEYHESRPGHASVTQAHHRPYGQDHTSTQSPSAQANSGSHERQRTASGSQTPHQMSMAEHGLPLHATAQQAYAPSIEQPAHLNGALPPNGVSYHPPEGYAVGPVAHQQPYPSTPTSAYPQTPGLYHHGPSNYGSVGMPRRKQVRATQACDNCRQRKQKCDEGRPNCGYCVQENLPCHYRDVPPPKTDRHIMQVLEGQEKITEQMSEMQAALNQLLQAASRHEPGQSIMPPPDGVKTIASRRLPDEGRKPTIGAQAPESDNDGETEGKDEPPNSHETGAQYLMKWPYIGEWFRKAGVGEHGYVFEEADHPGALRLYGSSRIEDGQLVEPLGDCDEDCVARDDHDHRDPAEGMWGDGLPVYASEVGTNMGGSNPDGSLDLTRETVMDLCDSYIKNMWNLHPFLDIKWLKEKTVEFISKHSPKAPRAQAQYPGSRFAMPDVPASKGRPGTPSVAIGKRKRASDTHEESIEEDLTERPRQWSAPKCAPDKSMQNAIILLVLALGKVLKDSRWLLDDLSTSPASDTSERSYANSPMDTAKPSPRSHSTYDSASSPGDFRAVVMARSASLDGSRRLRKDISNVHLFPGIAYLAEALSILGTNVGGNCIIHAQAYLLAGLYYGQLGRIMESWSWISEGCRVSTILYSKKKYKANLLQRESKTDDGPTNLVAYLCWSAVQLESDLRAELDQLPKPFNFMFSEAKIITPSELVGINIRRGERVDLFCGEKLDGFNILMSYDFQIRMRLILNQVHVGLYQGKKSIPNQEKRTTYMWVEPENAVHYDNLQNIRAYIAKITPFGWRDGTPPPRDMLAARLRGKYYGGSYIILRPYIYNALRWQSDGGGMHPSPPFELTEWIRRDEENERQAALERERISATPGGQVPPTNDLPQTEISYNSFQSNIDLAERFLWCCKRCIDAAMNSTDAFDEVANPFGSTRLRVTNIQGTATAQFSNMLVLVAVAKSWLRPMLDLARLEKLMQRTIVLHDKLSPLAMIFRTNRRVLEQARIDLRASILSHPQSNVTWDPSPGSGPGLQHSLSPASVSTPRIAYGPHAPASVHSSFGSKY